MKIIIGRKKSSMLLFEGRKENAQAMIVKKVEAPELREYLVDTILNNLKSKKRHIHALSILVEQEQTVYDITIDRKEFIATLEMSLPIYEKIEEFEKCAEIVKAIEYIKNKPKRGRPKKNLDK